MTNLILSRRGFLAGLGSLLAAPAVVKAENLMPIFPWPRRGQRLHRTRRICVGRWALGNAEFVGGAGTSAA